MNHKIALDVRMIESSGIGTTIRELLDHLESAKLKQLVLYGNQGWKNTYESDFQPTPYPIYGLKQHWNYAQFINGQNIKLYHMPHFDVPYFIRKPFVMTVHDLIHILFPEYSTKSFSKVYAQFILKAAAKKAKRIFVVSENTKKDLLNFMPEIIEKIRVIYPGVSQKFKPQSVGDSKNVLGKYNLIPGYIFYVGNLRASKNTIRLISAYGKLYQADKSVPPLVLAGKNFLGKSDFGPHVKYIGIVKTDELPYLYSQAQFFVFPSLYEGFGLPVLEAMACGIPVISSNRASLPEVGGDAAIYFDPESESDLISKMNQLIQSPESFPSIIERGKKQVLKFSWDEYAGKIWHEYESVLNEA